MNYDMKRSGAYIQNLRIQNGYTQGELAQAMNIDRSFLSRIESGSKGCSVDLFVQFSEFFHVSLDALILGMEPEPSLKNGEIVRLKADIAGLIDHLTSFQTQLK
jgi:transcriptional regulator with XRE-family HTH domain